MNKELFDKAVDILIGAEGNKFKAVKAFRESTSLSNDEAIEYINTAFASFNGETIDFSETEAENLMEVEVAVEDDNNEEGILVSEMAKRFDNKFVLMSEVRKFTGFETAESNKIVNDFLEEGKDSLLLPKKEEVQIAQKEKKSTASVVGGILSDMISEDIDMINDMRTYKNIKKTIIVGQESKKSATSSVARGIVGGALLGPAGMIAGGISGKNKNKTTFQIIYENGKQRTVTVKIIVLSLKNYVSI